MKDPAKHDWITIQEGEDVLFWEHPSIIPPLGAMIFGLLIAVGGVYIALFIEMGVYSLYVGGAVVLFGLMITAVEYIQRITTHYVITNKRIIKKTGVIRVDPIERDFSDIDAVDPVQGAGGIMNAVVERMFGFGDFEVSSDNGDISLNNVASYSEYHDEISKRNSMNSFREVMNKHNGGGAVPDEAVEQKGEEEEDSEETKNGN